jgi:hypothetical protein
VELQTWMQCLQVRIALDHVCDCPRKQVCQRTSSAAFQPMPCKSLLSGAQCEQLMIITSACDWTIRKYDGANDRLVLCVRYKDSSSSFPWSNRARNANTPRPTHQHQSKSGWSVGARVSGMSSSAPLPYSHPNDPSLAHWSAPLEPSQAPNARLSLAAGSLQVQRISLSPVAARQAQLRASVALGNGRQSMANPPLQSTEDSAPPNVAMTRSAALSLPPQHLQRNSTAAVGLQSRQRPPSASAAGAAFGPTKHASAIGTFQNVPRLQLPESPGPVAAPPPFAGSPVGDVGAISKPPERHTNAVAGLQSPRRPPSASAAETFQNVPQLRLPTLSPESPEASPPPLAGFPGADLNVIFKPPEHRTNATSLPPGNGTPVDFGFAIQQAPEDARQVASQPDAMQGYVAPAAAGYAAVTAQESQDQVPNGKLRHSHAASMVVKRETIAGAPARRSLDYQAYPAHIPAYPAQEPSANVRSDIFPAQSAQDQLAEAIPAAAGAARFSSALPPHPPEPSAWFNGPGISAVSPASLGTPAPEVSTPSVDTAGALQALPGPLGSFFLPVYRRCLQYTWVVACQKLGLWEECTDRRRLMLQCCKGLLSPFACLWV